MGVVVALKVLPPSTLADEAARKRFRKEALAPAKLSHANIGVIYDFATQNGVDFLVMEYIPARSWLKSGGSFGVQHSFFFSLQIAGK